MRESRTNNSGNAFYSARNEAAKYNERFSNKTSASDVLGMDRSRLSRIELGVINPYPEEVALMAAEYHKPELRAHYCRNICPLGRDVPIPDANSIDRITVRTLHASENLKKAKRWSRTRTGRSDLIMMRPMSWKSWVWAGVRLTP